MTAAGTLQNIFSTSVRMCAITYSVGIVCNPVLHSCSRTSAEEANSGHPSGFSCRVSIIILDEAAQLICFRLKGTSHQVIFKYFI